MIVAGGHINVARYQATNFLLKRQQLARVAQDLMQGARRFGENLAGILNGVGNAGHGHTITRFDDEFRRECGA